MAEAAPAPPAENAAKKKQPRKAAASKSRAVKSGPSVSELMLKVVSASKERSGVSMTALKKALAATGYDIEKNKSRVKLAVMGLVSKGTLTQVKGTGASGSFKLSKKPAESKEKAKKKVPAARPKKPAPKKVSKSPKKAPAGVKKSPKKVKKPAATAKKATKSPKKPKTVRPKKAKSPAKSATKAKPAKSPAKPKPRKAAAKK